MRYFKSIFMSLVLLLFAEALVAQEVAIKWHDPQKAGFYAVQGQGWSKELAGTYTRFPERTKPSQRQAVWKLSQNSAGLAVYFTTDAQKITVRYKFAGSAAMDHFSATGVSGVDLYSLNGDNKWRYYPAKRTKMVAEDTVTFTFSTWQNSDYMKSGVEYRLYLPLYATLKWLEIGVADGSTFTFKPMVNEKPIVAFGTSILQGACASRPGMAWTNIVARGLNMPVLNYGFSGNGTFEQSVVNLVSEIDAALYIMDCLPNMTSIDDAQMEKNILEGIRTLRSKSSAPILLTEHIIGVYPFSSKGAIHCNDILKKLYGQLQQEGVKDLYYITCQELALPADGTVDGTHPNDLGMAVIAANMEAKIRTILNVKFKGTF